MCLPEHEMLQQCFESLAADGIDLGSNSGATSTEA